MDRPPSTLKPSDPFLSGLRSAHRAADRHPSPSVRGPAPDTLRRDLMSLMTMLLGAESHWTRLSPGTREVPEARPNFDNSAGSGTLRYTNMPGELRVPTNCARQIDLVASRLRLSSSEMGDCIELPLRPHPRQHGIKPGFEVRSPVSGDRN